MAQAAIVLGPREAHDTIVLMEIALCDMVDANTALIHDRVLQMTTGTTPRVDTQADTFDAKYITPESSQGLVCHGAACECRACVRSRRRVAKLAKVRHEASSRGTRKRRPFKRR
jgi:hypothetical protein